MLEADTQIVPPPGREPAVEPQAERRPEADSREEPLVLRRWVGRYELIHRVAHGGMATVYLGRAKGKAGFEKVVAVKVIHPHLASEAEFVGMFLDEARIAARIHHPHVVEILDLGESDGVYFMVMEFIEGENLSALVRALAGERLPIAATLQVVADTLEGLSAAHELRDADGRAYKLVHRDVSPHNILINLDGWAKIGDFGIMKAAGKASNTKTGELRGKLAYMSPEQARGVAVDHRTDLFAVGVILWELLTGERLFACATEAATLEKVIACEVPRLAEHGVMAEHPALREELQRLLDRALAADAEHRHRDAAAMLAEVKRLLRMIEELPGVVEPRAYLGSSMQRFFRRRVEYARAALRRIGERPERPERPEREEPIGNPREWVEPTTPAARPPTGPHEQVEPIAARVQTGSNSIATGSASHSQVSGPVLQWSLWLLLPMLGAGIAIAAMLLFGPRFDTRLDTPPEQPQPVEPAPIEAPKTTPSLAATEYQPVPQQPTPPGQVRWYFSTAPRGARVTIDGELRGDPTPTWVHLPIGEDPLDIRIELDGYEPLTLQLPAVHDQIFSETLDPLAAETPSKPGKQGRKPGKLATSGSDKPQPGGQADGKPSNPGFVPPPDSLGDGKSK